MAHHEQPAESPVYEAMAPEDLEHHVGNLQAMIRQLRSELRHIQPILDMRRESAEVSKRLGHAVHVVPVTTDEKLGRRLQAAAGLRAADEEG